MWVLKHSLRHPPFDMYHIQAKKKPKNKLNGIGLKLAKLLLQLIRCAKSRRKLSVHYGQLNVVVLQLRKRSNMPSTCKPGKSFE
jgi:hypothetical protein